MDPDRSDSPPHVASRLDRLPIEAMGYYYVDEAATGGRPAPALVGLHGFAQTAADFLGVVRMLAPPEWVAVAPQGFHQLSTSSRGDVSFSWLTAFEKEDSIERNNRFIASILDTLAWKGLINPHRIFLLGFSQGSSVAYRFAHRRRGRVRGIISICSDLPPDVEANLEPLRETAVMIFYGLQDKFIPRSKPEHAAKALAAGGIDVEARSFDRGHLIPSSITPDVRRWMGRILGEESTEEAVRPPGESAKAKRA